MNYRFASCGLVLGILLSAPAWAQTQIEQIPSGAVAVPSQEQGLAPSAQGDQQQLTPFVLQNLSSQNAVTTAVPSSGSAATVNQRGNNNSSTVEQTGNGNVVDTNIIDSDGNTTRQTQSGSDNRSDLTINGGGDNTVTVGQNGDGLRSNLQLTSQSGLNVTHQQSETGRGGGPATPIQVQQTGPGSGPIVINQ